MPLIFIMQNRPKVKLFLPKNTKFSSAGSYARPHPNLRNSPWIKAEENLLNWIEQLPEEKSIGFDKFLVQILNYSTLHFSESKYFKSKVKCIL